MAKKSNNQNTANLGFEAKLWAATDTLRNNMDCRSSDGVGRHV